jgi:hypothetical protein
MRRTLGLVLALPASLVLLGGASPSAGGDAVPADVPAASVATAAQPSAGPPSPASPAADLTPLRPTDPAADPTASGSAPPAGEAGDLRSGADRDGLTGPGRSVEGFLVAAVPEVGGVAGTGPRWRYTIEVDPATGLDPEDVARQVRTALHDERSWVRERTLEQVDEPARARIRLVVAAPETVDALCARAGLRTNGIFSCWNGRFAALNAWRWEVGAAGFEEIAQYRTYLINHEVGHGFGYGHVGCPAPGAPAPVMMQQTKGLDGCVANGWPYP